MGQSAEGNLLLIRHPVCGILLQQLNQTKTAGILECFIALFCEPFLFSDHGTCGPFQLQSIVLQL